ncbi:hypothetical protein CPC08DRAFT_610463, partial [Agrocybe pediades]
PQPNGYSCYWLEVVGCSSEVLNDKIVSGDALRQILGTRSIFDEASENEQESILRLKPLFNQSAVSFSWA